MKKEHSVSPVIDNPFSVVSVPRANTVGAVATVATAEQKIQAMLVIAKKFPRDETRNYERIIRACQRPGLAEISQYNFARGGTKITGPTIDLMQAIAGYWQNVAWGWDEVERRLGESTIESWAWDYENNIHRSIRFVVKFVRDTQEGAVELTSERDIYEHCANMASRRIRACLEALIPGDVVEAAVNECDRTMASGHKEPLIDRVRKMVVAFAEKGVTKSMLEKRLQHSVDASSESELVGLRKIYNSMRDGLGSREDYFDTATAVIAKPVIEPAPATPVQPPVAPQPEEFELKTEPPQAATQPAKEPAAGQEGEPDDPRFNELLLRDKLNKAGIDEDRFVRWAVAAKLISGPIPIAEMPTRCPKRLINFLRKWDEYLPSIQQSV
jgi:hypothetical protein